MPGNSAQRLYSGIKAGDSGAMLAGVCSRLATRLGWNVWAIRAVLLILLVAKPLWTIIGYAAAALLFSALQRGAKSLDARTKTGPGNEQELQSPELATRRQRIDELEQRFREWERTLPRD